MSERARRADIRRAYKETLPRAGVFAVDDPATGAVWVDRAPNVDVIQNRIWFTLRLGTHRVASLQQAWNDSGGALAYRIVETAPEDATPYERERWLADRVAHWRSELKAGPAL